jgi:hypothetical protein
MEGKENDYTLSMEYYATRNNCCEVSKYLGGRIIGNGDLVPFDNFMSYPVYEKIAKLEIHHIFGRISNDHYNLIRILRDPFHNKSHSHNSIYDNELQIMYILIKMLKAEFGITELKKLGQLHLFEYVKLAAEGLIKNPELQNNFRKYLLAFDSNRINKYGYCIFQDIMAIKY